MELKSKSDKRIIVEGIVNDNKVNLLVDTGATVGLIDESRIRMLGIKKGRLFPSSLVGASGEMMAWYCPALMNIGEKVVGQFLIADIEAVVDSIKRETGTTISGIISLPQLSMIGAIIDTKKKEIIIS